MLHREESADASWPSLPTNEALASYPGLILIRPGYEANEAHAEKTAMDKNNRDLQCTRTR